MSFVKKSDFQTVIFAIIFVTMNGHTYKLFKTSNFNAFLTDGKGEKIWFNITTPKFVF